MGKSGKKAAAAKAFPEKTRRDRARKQELQKKTRAKQRKEINQILDENPDWVALTVEFLRDGLMEQSDSEDGNDNTWHCSTSKLGDLPKYFMAELINEARPLFDETFLSQLDRANKGFLPQLFTSMTGTSLKWLVPKQMLDKTICKAVLVKRIMGFKRFPEKGAVKLSQGNKINLMTVGAFRAKDDGKHWRHEATGADVAVDIGTTANYTIKYNHCDTEAKICRGSTETAISKFVKAQELSTKMKAFSLQAFVEQAVVVTEEEAKKKRDAAIALSERLEEKAKKAAAKMAQAAASASSAASSKPSWTRKWRKGAQKKEASSDDEEVTVKSPAPMRLPNF